MTMPNKALSILLTIVLTVAMVLSCGCSVAPVVATEAPQESDNLPPVDNSPPVAEAELPQGGTTTAAPLQSPSSEPAKDVTWIMPAKVDISNVRPGDMASCDMEVHNGKSYAARFEIKFRMPDRVREGYVAAPASYVRYVTVTPAFLDLGPYETGVVSVLISIPANDPPPDCKWEFWISSMDTEVIGLLRQELCARWQVAMDCED